MFEQNKILVVDTASKSKLQLQTILKFINQPYVILDPENPQQEIHNNCFALFIYGEALDPNVIEFIKKLKKQDEALPLILLGLDSKSQKKLLDGSKVFYQQLAEPLCYEALQKAIKQCRTHYHQHQLEARQDVGLYQSLVGNSRAINQVRQLIEQVASTDASVLILGESGTGKEITAQSIHEHSARSSKPFVPINCGAIPADLLESELFGHEKGAFTGAISTRKGRFELADGGTLFLDEIGDMPLAMQVKLLRILQERKFERIGSNQSIEVDVRIIAATHRNLEQEIEKGNFREDLYYRLNVFPIEIPPLRQRVEDIPLLINELLSRLEQSGRATAKLMLDAIQALCQYSWPGNIRELANTVERLSILYPNGIVDYQALPSRYKKINESDKVVEQSEQSSDEVEQGLLSVNLSNQGIDLKEHLMKMELALISQALDESDWVVARAATCLKMRRTTLVEKMRKYGLSRPEKA